MKELLKAFVSYSLGLAIISLLLIVTYTYAQDSSFLSSVNYRTSDKIGSTPFATHNRNRGRKISDFLTSDGRFDLRAARRSGYQGALDIKGYQFVFDSVSGQPIFRSVNLASPADTDDVYWDNSISLSVDSGNGDVYATTVYNGLLIVGGHFSIPGDTVVNNIATWDGVSWSLLSSKIDGSIKALTVFDNQLIAGGIFDTAGGVAAKNIAAWDGFSWSPLGSGIRGGDFPYIMTFTIYNNRLIAGGEFTIAGNVMANGIAAWDGLSWASLGKGMGGFYPYVEALATYNNQLIAGGDFTSAGSVLANHIAAWDGSSWSPLDSGLDDIVLALTTYNDQLIAGGFFIRSGSLTTNHIAAWDGSSWSPLGLGMNELIFDLITYDSQLIAGGFFIRAGGLIADRIAAWNGFSWSPLGSGIGGEYSSYQSVEALTVYDNNLIAGGDFTIAGGKVSAYLAEWTKGNPTDVNDDNRTRVLPEQYRLSQNYPNPFNPSTDISFSLPKAEHIKLEIYNIMGQKVSTLVNEYKKAGVYTVSWNANKVASGIYFYRLTAGEFIQTKKMMFLK